MTKKLYENKDNYPQKYAWRAISMPSQWGQNVLNNSSAESAVVINFLENVFKKIIPLGSHIKYWLGLNTASQKNLTGSLIFALKCWCLGIMYKV